MHIHMLSSGDIRSIHDASLAILARAGIQLPHDEALTLFEAAGAKVDRDSQRVHIPESLVESALASCGKQFTLFGRDKERQARFGQGRRNYNAIAGEAFWVDDDHNRRYTTLDDVAMAARLGDALPRLTMPGAMADPMDIPPEGRCVAVAAAMLENTTKPVAFWFHDRASARFLNELFTLVAGGEKEAAAHPFTYPLLEPITPLRFPFHGVDLLFETCRFPLPVAIGPMAQMGATAPGTLAATLALENAEILAGICLVQLIRPGTPVCYGGIPHTLDMRTTQMVFAGPEQALMAVAMTEMGKHYGLPVYINVGLTDSKTPDAQAGMEAGITLTCGALAGADIFGHLGICGVDQGTSLTMLVMQHELIGYVERLARGSAISDETLGVDTIVDAGPGATFINDSFTAMHFREELWFPDLLDRDYFEVWSGKGRKDMRDRCIALKDELLRAHQPSPMPEDMRRDMLSIAASARRLLADN